eukprot:00936.XXX_2166_1895_1 [CDS] Oithona nana genome sequencing.
MFMQQSLPLLLCMLQELWKVLSLEMLPNRWWKERGYETVGGMWTFRTGGLRKTHREIRLKAKKIQISFDFN